MVLLDICEKQITRADSCTNLVFPFRVEKPLKALEIFYTYSPKKVTDLEVCREELFKAIEKYGLDEPLLGPGSETKETLRANWKKSVPMLNHTTLSLDYLEDGKVFYVGAAHRHNPDQHHLIGEDFSSPGFLRVPIRPGDWRVMVNIHAAMSDDIRLNLKVLGREE